MAANTPPIAGIVAAGAPVSGGYPVFVSQDSNGTLVTPHGQYVWNPNAGSNGLWVPAPVDANGNLQTASATAPLSPVTVMQNAATTTGPGTNLPTSGYGVAIVAVSGTFSATITWQGIGPDGSPYPINARLKGSSTPPSPTATAPGLYEVDCRGLSAVQANITSYTSGNVTVKGWAQALSAPAGTVNAQITGSTIQMPVDIQNCAQTLPVAIQSASFSVFFNVYNNLTITDTAVHNFSNSAMQLGSYGRKVIEIYSTLNQPVTVTFIRANDQPYQMPVYSTNGGSGAGGGTVTWKPCSITVPAAPNTSTPVIAMITANDWPILGEPLSEPSNVTAQCSTAPTAGSVQMKLHAMPLC